MNPINDSIKIGLLWHSTTSDNLGVGALTAAQIAICEAAAAQANLQAEYVIFGTHGGRDYMPTGVVAKKGGRVSIKQILLGRSQFLTELDACDIVLDIGEGDSFADIYGVKRYLFLIVSKLAVLLKRKPLVLSPQTIGPFKHFWTRWLANAVMKRCHYVYARDRLSFEYLVTHNLTQHVGQVIDVAFKLPFNAIAHTSKKVRIGLNVSGLLFSGGYTQNNQFGLTVNYAELVSTLIASWLKKSDCEVWLIPHVIPDALPIEDDRKAIEVLHHRYPGVQVAPEFNSPSEAKSFIASMDFMTGARMHACIAAFSSGVPVVPLAYSRKFNGLFNSLDYPWFADGKQLTTTQAIAMIEEGFEKREMLKQLVDAGNRKADQLITQYQDYLSQLFQDVMHARVS